MTQNPFENGTPVNPYDRPLINGQPIGGKSSADANTVIFDAASGQVNMAGHALQKWLLGEVTKQTEALVDVFAEHLAALHERVASLEAALVTEQERTSKAIATAVTGFLDTDDDDAPLGLATLESMAAEHKKSMEGLKDA